MLKPGGTGARKIGQEIRYWPGADGLAFGDKTTLYVNSFTTNKFLRVGIGPSGKATKVVKIKNSPHVGTARPECARSASDAC